MRRTLARRQAHGAGSMTRRSLPHADVQSLRREFERATATVKTLIELGSEVLDAYEEGIEAGHYPAGRGGVTGRPISGSRGFVGDVDPTGDVALAYDARRVRQAVKFLRRRIRHATEALEEGAQALRDAFLDQDPTTREARERAEAKREAALQGEPRLRTREMTLVGLVGVHIHRQTARLRCFECDWAHTLTAPAIKPAAHGAAAAHTAEHAGEESA